MRPEKFYRAMRNGDSLQFWAGEEYLGTLSVKKLCFYVAGLKGFSIQEGKNTKPALLQEEGKNTETGVSPETLPS